VLLTLSLAFLRTETGWTIGWVSATIGMRRMNTSFWQSMQPTADAIDKGAAHAVCVDFFEDLGNLHCGRHNHDQPRPGPPPGPSPAPPLPPTPPPPAPMPLGTFNFSANWSSGGPATTLPAVGFAVRKVEFVYYPKDGYTYAYADIINYTDRFYPESFSSEVGVFSSPDGKTGWTYHGVVVPRGKAGGWDAGGIASPGAAVAADGTVLVGFAAEQSADGGVDRAIGLATAVHPLGPFVKADKPLASPAECKGYAPTHGAPCHDPRGCGSMCDDVIMQTRSTGGQEEVHVYYSSKTYQVGLGILHRVSTTAGKSWTDPTVVLSTNASVTPTPAGGIPVETIAGKYFPSVMGGKGRMVLITDGGPGWCLHAYVSATPGDMENFVAADQPCLAAHPPPGAGKGDWANIQIAFVPGLNGSVHSVGYTLWDGVPVRNTSAGGYTMTLYDFALTEPAGSAAAS
jgi:hypothetical protein